MKIKTREWVRIENEEQFKLFEQINPGLNWYNGDREKIANSGFNCWAYNADTMGFAACERSAVGILCGYTEYKLPKIGPIPEGWRLVDKDKDAFTTDAKVWCKTIDAWDQTGNKHDYSMTMEYIIPATHPEGNKLPNNSYVVINDESDFELFRKTYPGDTLLYAKDPIDSEKAKIIARKQIYKDNSGMLGTCMGSGYGTQVHLPKPEKASWIKEFVVGTCIKVTNDNLEYLKGCIGDMKWNDGSYFKDWQSSRIETGHYYLARVEGYSGFTSWPEPKGTEIRTVCEDYIIDKAQRLSEKIKPADEAFPRNHYFKNTPENIDEFLRRFKNVKSNLGYAVNRDWFDARKINPEFGMDQSGRLGHVSSSGRGWYADNGYTRFVFEHETEAKPVEASPEPKPDWVDKFVSKTFIKVTKDNAEEVKKHLCDLEWASRKPFSDHTPHGWPEVKLYNNHGLLTHSHYEYVDNSYTEVFIGEQPEHKYKVGDSIVVTHKQANGDTKDAFWTKYDVGTVATIKTVGNGEVIAWTEADMKSNRIQILKLTQIRPATSQDLPAAIAAQSVKHEYKVGDKVVVTKNNQTPGKRDPDVYWTEYDIGDVVEITETLSDGDVVAKKNGRPTQNLRQAQIRPATPQDLLAAGAKAASAELAKIVEDQSTLCTDEQLPKEKPGTVESIVREDDGSMTITTTGGSTFGGCSVSSVKFSGESVVGKMTLKEMPAIASPGTQLRNTITESIPAGTLVFSVPTSTSEKEEKKMLTQSERDEVIKLAVQAASTAAAAKSGPGVTSKATGLAATAAKGLAGWALAPAKPVGRLAIKLLQYGVFLVGVVGGGSYIAYWTYNNGKDYLPTIEFKKTEDKSPKDSVVNSVTTFATTGEITG